MPFRFRFPTLGQILATVSLLGVVVLACGAGAAIMYFDLPGSAFLRKAFKGAQFLHDQEQASASNRNSAAHVEITVPTVTVDKSDKTCDGFTLYSTTTASAATLVDMRGHVVHRWELPFSKAWPKPPHVPRVDPDVAYHWFRTHLSPNGELLAVYHTWSEVLNGRGLVKLDKDSRPLWVYSACAHHDVDVSEDGTIYCLTQALRKDMLPGFLYLSMPWMAENLVLLSPDGQELDSIPIAETLRDSPYALTLHQSSCDRVALGRPQTRLNIETIHLDRELLHTNSVRVLSKSRAAHFPLFKPGQVLLSLRSLSTVAVLDARDRTVPWAARGIWRSQHDADFLDNGHLLFYDNLGGFNGSRVLEYDPVRQGIAWSYEDESTPRFTAIYRGVVQRLPNGNTLIADPDHGRLFEVTPSKELVWECLCPMPPPIRSKEGRLPPLAITAMRRYGPEEIRFLKEGVRPRP